MVKLKLISGILLIFIMGVLVGSIGTGIFTKHRITRFLRGAEPPAPRILKKLTAELDLSELQQEKVEKILRQSRTQWVELRKKYQPEFQKIFDENIAQLKEPLNNEQRRKLDKLYEKLMRHAPHPGRRGPFPSHKSQRQNFPEIRKRLNLTETQEKEVRPIMEESMEKQRKIFQKLQNQQEQALRSFEREMRENQKSVEKRLSRILTTEQMDKYRKNYEEQGPGMRRHRPVTLD
jgi:hypothetical protein